MNPNCARCGKIVYPTEKVNCLDKVSSGTGRRELASASAALDRGKKEGLGLLRALPCDPQSWEGRREETWDVGTDPSLEPRRVGPGRGGEQPPLEKDGLCASGLGG